MKVVIVTLDLMKLTVYIEYNKYKLSSHQEHRLREIYDKGKRQVIKVVIVILDLMTLTGYTSTIQVQIIITLGTGVKRDI